MTTPQKPYRQLYPGQTHIGYSLVLQEGDSAELHLMTDKSFRGNIYVAAGHWRDSPSMLFRLTPREVIQDVLEQTDTLLTAALNLSGWGLRS